LAILTQLELRQSNPKLRNKINAVLKPYLTVIDSIIRDGIKQDLYQNNLNLPLVRQMIFGTLDETVTNWVMQGHKYDIVKQTSEVHALLTKGFSV